MVIALTPAVRLHRRVEVCYRSSMPVVSRNPAYFPLRLQREKQALCLNNLMCIWLLYMCLCPIGGSDILANVQQLHASLHASFFL